MDNHVHLIVVPKTEQSLAAVFGPLHTRYAQYVNERQNVTGHLWQGRYHSCPMDESHLYSAVRYVERNPIKAGFVERAEDWPWSSAPGHVTPYSDELLSDPCSMYPNMTPEQWRHWLTEPWEKEEAFGRTLARRTQTGKPAGSAEFVHNAEKHAQKAI